MKSNSIKINLLFLFLTCNFFAIQAQNPTKNKPSFWDNVQFGGGLGLNIGNRFTEITIAPGAIYNFNEFFAAGVGLQYSYIDFKEEYKSNLYGGSLIALTNPFPEIQISAELEQIYANINFEYIDVNKKFWNTALFLGIGFRTNNITAGVKYNVLHKKDKFVYAEPFMPFVRIYF